MSLEVTADKVYKIVRTPDTVIILRQSLQQFAVWESAADTDSPAPLHREKEDEAKAEQDEEISVATTGRRETEQTLGNVSGLRSDASEPDTSQQTNDVVAAEEIDCDKRVCESVQTPTSSATGTECGDDFSTPGREMLSKSNRLNC
jgi:hypothetical protein